MFKQNYSLIFLSALIVSLFFGCGIEAENTTKIPIVKKHINSQTRTDKIEFSYDEDPEFKTTDFIVDSNEKLKVVVTSTYVYLIFNHSSMAPNVQFFLNTDNNEKTGYQYERGVEYIIENGTLYISKNDTKWDWEEDLNEISINTKLGQYDVARLSRDIFETNGKFKAFTLNAQALNKNWIPRIYAPKTHYTLLVEEK
jgi:hypothetical protein